MKSFSDKPLGALTVDALQRGELVPDDVRIHPSTLEHQASVAAAHGNPQLAANLLRAAELTAFAEDEILSLYESLRPHRSTAADLAALAADLDSRAAPRCAALVREAAAVYARRGLLKR